MRIQVRFVYAYGRIMIFIDFPRVNFKMMEERTREYCTYRGPRLFVKEPTLRWTCRCGHDNWEDHYDHCTIDALLLEELQGRSSLL